MALLNEIKLNKLLKNQRYLLSKNYIEYMEKEHIIYNKISQIRMRYTRKCNNNFKQIYHIRTVKIILQLNLKIEIKFIQNSRTFEKMKCHGQC